MQHHSICSGSRKVHCLAVDKKQTTILILFVFLALFACSACGRRPPDETPEGTVELLLSSMRMRNQKLAFKLLAPKIQDALEKRAVEASRQAGRTLKAAEMLAVERYMERWEISKMTAQKNGDRATVTVHGSNESQTAEVELIRIKDKWRVLLPLY